MESMCKRVCIALACVVGFLFNTVANAVMTPCSNFWPQDGNGGTVIPVCYTAAQAARPGFAQWLPVARQAIESTWGRAANISFTGWRQCPANPTGEMVVIDYQASTPLGTVTCHAPGQVDWAYQDPASISPDNWAHTAVHEFGHALGFK